MTQQNRFWTLARRPVGDIRDGDLVFEKGPIPKAKKGEIVLRTEFLSLDPTNRVWMSDMDQYMPPVAVGDPMRGFVAGKVVESTVETVAVGTHMMGIGTWSDYCRVPAADFLPVPEVKGISRKDVFGQYGVVGPTAYFGLVDIGVPKIGETMVVSGAAGAVGSLAVQLGRVMGCKVVAIAGGKQKCAWIKDELGADGVIDYKSESVKDRLMELCPEGVDVFFDNVAGETLSIVMAQMNHGGRIVQCGFISSYNAGGKSAAPANYPYLVYKRLKVAGFVVMDYYPRYSEAIRALTKLHLEGKMKWRYHDIPDLEGADQAVRLLMTGGNHGKLMVKVSDVG